MIEALAKGVRGPAELADTPVLAGLLTHSPAKEGLVQHHLREAGMTYPVSPRSVEATREGGDNGSALARATVVGLL